MLTTSLHLQYQQPLCNAGLKVISLYSLFVACGHYDALPFLQLAVTNNLQQQCVYHSVCVRFHGHRSESTSSSIDSGGKVLGAKCPEVS